MVTFCSHRVRWHEKYKLFANSQIVKVKDQHSMYRTCRFETTKQVTKLRARYPITPR